MNATTPLRSKADTLVAGVAGVASCPFIVTRCSRFEIGVGRSVRACGMRLGRDLGVAPPSACGDRDAAEQLIAPWMTATAATQLTPSRGRRQGAQRDMRPFICASNSMDARCWQPIRPCAGVIVCRRILQGSRFHERAVSTAFRLPAGGQLDVCDRHPRSHESKNQAHELPDDGCQALPQASHGSLPKGEG